MSFANATITKKANVYHDGRVTSRSIVTSDGDSKTLGVMLPGTYRFNTQAPEVMEITQGVCRVRIGDQEAWLEVKAGEQFGVPANSSFEIEVTALLDYICHFA